ncbi:hypothetical protein OG819_00275 [Streptomyces sp. NBC_01549]|nr:hypothetical protein [Streptomyces sp. NBC_01549]
MVGDEPFDERRTTQFVRRGTPGGGGVAAGEESAGGRADGMHDAGQPREVRRP